MNRRQFGLGSAAALLALAAGFEGCSTPGILGRARRPLRLLVLGGTQFFGVHLVREALRRAHTVTLFNRGRTNPGLFPDVEKLRGDRDGQLDALRGREWDCVIDDSGLLPRQVQLTTALLAPSVRQYVFISSIDAYASFAQPNSEDSPLQPLRGTATGATAEPAYGEAKVISESLVRSAFPASHVILRPGMVVGPLDPASRIAYWLACASRSGPWPVPGSARDPIQFIDARDLARFALDRLEQDDHGTWNVASAPGQFTMGQLVAACAANARRAQPATRAEPVWLPREFLEARGVATAFPLWPGNRQELALPRVDTHRARSAGLRITRLKSTVADTMDWLRGQPEWQQQALRSGLGIDAQQELLRAWHG